MITTGTVLIYHTCDGFKGFGSNSIQINPHDEHYLVKDIQKFGFILYNLDRKTKNWVVSRGELNYLLSQGILEISEEVA